MQVLVQEDAVAALAERSLAVVPYRERWDALAEHLGVDFGAVAAALDGLPLCLRGEAHLARRTEVARLIAERRGVALEAMEGIVRARFGRLRRAGPCDMMEEVVLPCVDDLLAVLSGLPIGAGGDSLMSRLFSESMGVAKRRRLNAEVEACRALVGETFPREPQARHDARLTLLILGRDALIGTLGLSLRDHFERLGGLPLSSLALPTVPTHTGVPFVDRQATADLSLRGRAIGAGETVRVGLDGFQGMAEEWRHRFFGGGRHLCLGRPLTLALMERISAMLSTLDMRVEVTRFELRKDDVFAFPGAFRIVIAA